MNITLASPVQLYLFLDLRFFCDLTLNPKNIPFTVGDFTLI